MSAGNNNVCPIGSEHAMSQSHNAEHGILGEDMLRTVPQRDGQLGLVLTASVGRSAPLGATVSSDGVNFSLYSRDASGVELLLFDDQDDGCPSPVIRLEPTTNRPYHYWHVFTPGL